MALFRHIALVIGLLGPIASWSNPNAISHVEKRSELCQSAVITSHNCQPTSELVLSAINSCEIEWKANNCDQLQADHPELVAGDKLKNCESPAACAMPASIQEHIGVCMTGLKESWGDAGAFILGFITGTGIAPSEEALNKIDFFKNCTSDKCKREMLGPFESYFRSDEIEGNKKYLEINPNLIGSYKKATPFESPEFGYEGKLRETSSRDITKNNYYDGKSAATLYRQLLLKLKKDSKSKNMDDKFITPWSGQAATLPMSWNELIDQALTKSGIENTACFHPAVVTEMRCYALFSILNPPAAVGASGVIAKIAGFAGRAEGEVLVSAGKSAANVGKNALKEPKLLPFNKLEELRIAKSTTKIPEEYARRSTDAFVVKKIYSGSHGGNRIAVERQGTWSDTRKDFTKGGGDIVLDLRTWPQVLGSKEADFFGYRVVSDKFVILPDEKELSGAISKFNEGLPANAPERIAIDYYPTKSSFNSKATYVRKFAEEGKLPISTNGRQFYHDTLGHGMQGVIFNNEFVDVMRSRSKMWLDFVDSQKNLTDVEQAALNKINDKIIKNLANDIDQSGNLMGSFMQSEDRTYLKQVGLHHAVNMEIEQRKNPTMKSTLPTSDPAVLPPYISYSTRYYNLLSGKAGDYFLPELEDTPSLEAKFEQHLKQYDQKKLKPVSFDWKSDLNWLNENNDKIKNDANTLNPELGNRALTRPFYLRAQRLRQLQNGSAH